MHCTEAELVRLQIGAITTDHNRPMAALVSRCSIYLRTQAAQYQPSAHVDLTHNDCFIGKSPRV